MSKRSVVYPILLAAASALRPVAYSSEVEKPAASKTTLPTVRVQADLPEDYRAEAAPTATKTDTPLHNVPQSISVVTRQLLDDLNTQNIGDAMLYVPGVGMAQGEGNRETSVIRGSSSTGDFFLDGMRDDVQYLIRSTVLS